MPNGDGTSGPGPRPGERALQQILLQQVQAGTISWAEARQKLERFYFDQGVSPAEILRKVQDLIVPYLGGQDFWTATTQQSGGVRPQHTWEPDPTQPGGVRLRPASTVGIPFDPSAWPPPPTPRPTPTGVGGVPGQALSISDIAQAYDPYTAFLQGLGVSGREYRTPMERYGVSQYQPAKTLFGIGQLLGDPSIGSGTTQPDYLDKFALGLAGQVGGARDVARSYLQSIMGLTPEQIGASDLRLGSSYMTETEKLPGEEETESTVADLQDLLQLAYRGRGGGRYANWLAERAGKEQQIYASRQAAGEQLDPFMQYLQQKYNLKF